MKTSIWPPNLRPEVRHELFVLGYRNLLVHSIGQIFLASLVAAASRTAVEARTLFAWIGWALLTVASLFFGMWLYRRQAKLRFAHAPTLKQWQWSHPAFLTMVGISWGSAGFLMVPALPTHNAMILVAFAGVLAYSALSNAPNDPIGFTVSATIAALLMMLRVPAAFGAQAIYIVAMCVLYVSVLALAARNARSTLLASIELRLDNEILARTNAANAARAEQANRDKSAFLAAASHDLRQPVHALLLLIEAYRQEVPAAANHPLMQHITAAGQSIRSLFNALMELSRLESGTENPVLMACNLADMAGNALNRISPEAVSKGLELRSFISRNLPWHTARTDKYMLERVIGNLLSNAVNYTPRGGILLSLRPAHGENGLWLEVWDTGIGIAESDHERIFDPYVQVGNRERDRSKGLGLGLAIVGDILNLLGMKLTLNSRVGHVSCFRVHLPIALQDPEVRDPHLSIETSVITRVPELAGRRILLVDDDPMVQQAMQALLRG